MRCEAARGSNALARVEAGLGAGGRKGGSQSGATGQPAARGSAGVG